MSSPGPNVDPFGPEVAKMNQELYGHGSSRRPTPFSPSAQPPMPALYAQAQPNDVMAQNTAGMASLYANQQPMAPQFGVFGGGKAPPMRFGSFPQYSQPAPQPGYFVPPMTGGFGQGFGGGKGGFQGGGFPFQPAPQQGYVAPMMGGFGQGFGGGKGGFQGGGFPFQPSYSPSMGSGGLGSLRAMLMPGFGPRFSYGQSPAYVDTGGGFMARPRPGG